MLEKKNTTVSRPSRGVAGVLPQQYPVFFEPSAPSLQRSLAAQSLRSASPVVNRIQQCSVSIAYYTNTRIGNYAPGPLLQWSNICVCNKHIRVGSTTPANCAIRPREPSARPICQGLSQIPSPQAPPENPPHLDPLPRPAMAASNCQPGPAAVNSVQRATSHCGGMPWKQVNKVKTHARHSTAAMEEIRQISTTAWLRT